MKRIKRLLFITFIFVPSLCFAHTSWKRMPNLRKYAVSTAVKKIMHNWLGRRETRSHIGIVIQSLRTGKILYKKNAHHLFTPASVQKLFTAVAALDYLKPDFQFKTVLLSNGNIQGGRLKGSLILKFGGDPDLTDDDLRDLIAQLHRLGIREITGPVYIDATEYGNVPYPPGWIWDDLSYSFAAPLMTTIINHNYFSLKLKSPSPGRRHPIIETNLPAGVVTFTNEVKVVNHANQNCPLRIYSDMSNHYILRGCYYRRWKQQVRKIAIRNVPKYARVLFRNALRKNNIAYDNPIEFHSANDRDHVIAEHESPPLRKIIKEMLKDSDNLMTNAVFKKLGEEYFQGHGTWQNSLKALKKLLARPTGINFKTNLINDGAGLSRYNLITPRQLSKLLYFAYHNRTVKSALLDALPIAGRDGTMAYRLQDQRRGGRIRMKTGSMTGVTALAGYIHTKHNGNLSLVIMVNGFVKPRKPYIGMEDDICRYLVSTYKHG